MPPVLRYDLGSAQLILRLQYINIQPSQSMYPGITSAFVHSQRSNSVAVYHNRVVYFRRCIVDPVAYFPSGAMTTVHVARKPARPRTAASGISWGLAHGRIDQISCCESIRSCWRCKYTYLIISKNRQWSWWNLLWNRCSMSRSPETNARGGWGIKWITPRAQINVLSFDSAVTQNYIIRFGA